MFWAADEFAERGKYSFGGWLRGNDVNVCVRVVKFLCGSLADGADFDLVEIGNVEFAFGKTFQEKLDAVRAREDQPVVTVKVVKCFVETVVGVGFTDLDGWADKNFCAVVFECIGELLRLRSCACDNDRYSF